MSWIKEISKEEDILLKKLYEEAEHSYFIHNTSFYETN